MGEWNGSRSEAVSDTTLDFNLRSLPISVRSCIDNVINPELASFIFSIPKTCFTKQGTLNCQKFINKASKAQIDEVYQVVLPQFPQMMMNTYANYTCQTIFTVSSSKQRIRLLLYLEKSLPSLAIDYKASHALQTLASLCSCSEEEMIYARAFKGCILNMAYHPNACYILQKLCTTITDLTFIVEEIIKEVSNLCMDKHGLNLIKKCIIDLRISECVSKNFLNLIQDPYGNYAAQLLVKHHADKFHENINAQIAGKVPQLCVQKYSSNVIEKCLEAQHIRDAILTEITCIENLKLVMNSNYGCYVIKTAALNSHSKQRSDLYLAVTQTLPFLSKKGLKSRWNKILELLS